MLSACLLCAPVGLANRASLGTCPAWVTVRPTPAGPARTTSPTSRPVRSRLGSSSGLVYQTDGIAVGPTRASVDTRVSASVGSVLVRYGATSDYRACSAAGRPEAGVSLDKTHILLKGLRPDATYHFQVVAKTAAGPVFGVDRTLRTLPGGYVPQGVMVGPVALGGMSRHEARAVLARALMTPLRMSYAGAFWHVSRARAGAHVNAKHALAAALTASPGQLLPPLKVSIDRARLRAFVAGLDNRWSRKSQPGDVRLAGTRAVITPLRAAVKVDTHRMATLIDTEITRGGHEVVPLAVTKTAAPRSSSPPQKAVVVRLGLQTLTAYLNGKPVLNTPVTTGRPALPTPIGSYYIHFRASPYTFVSPWPPGSPYWYPPTPVTWAMFFFDNDFLHNDPGEPSNAYGAGSQYGPYASHGCVHVPYDAMAFLYNWLPVGATVIVSQT